MWKTRKTCEKPFEIESTYKDQTIIDKLSKNADLIILSQDKVGGVTILDCQDNIQKRESILNKSQFR